MKRKSNKSAPFQCGKKVERDSGVESTNSVWREAYRIKTSLIDFHIDDRRSINPIRQILATKDGDELLIKRVHDDNEVVEITVKDEYIVYWTDVTGEEIQE